MNVFEIRKDISDMCEVLTSRTTLEDLREADELLAAVMEESAIIAGQERSSGARMVVDAAQEISRRIIHMETGEEYEKET